MSSYVVSEVGRDLDFRRIVGKLWPGRWFILLLGILGASVAGLITLVLPPSYTLEMILTPVGNEAGSSNSALRALGGLQQTPEEARFGKFKVVLTSGQLATALLADATIMHGIFPNEWNESIHSWRPPGGWLAEGYYGIAKLFGLPGWRPPSAERLHDFVEKRVSVTPDRETGFATVAFSSRDPLFAQSFLIQIYCDSDNILRKAERQRLDQNIAYIKSRLDAISVTDYRTRLLEILEDLEKRRMLVSSNTPFAAEILDPPLIPPFPTFPRPIVFLLIGFLLGALIGGVVFYVSPGQFETNRIWPVFRPKDGFDNAKQSYSIKK